MCREEEIEEIRKRRREWEEKSLKPALRRFGATESTSRFYSPDDVNNFHFLEKVGFPGEYPFTAGTYPGPVPGSAPQKGTMEMGGGGGLVRAGRYSGYGCSEDMRDFYREMQAIGWRSGPRIAFDLPTQCGYDSDATMARGEVGRAGVAVDTLWDIETIYETFTGELDLDKIASVLVINAPANIILAMYMVMAEKRDIPFSKMRATLQNDILKEFVARGNYIFPPRPSLRMTRDTITFCNEHMPLVNSVTVNAYHIREAGATGPQALAFALSNGIAYMQLGTDAGLDVDDFAHRITFGSFSGSMKILREIALRRAARRMWAKIMRERLGAKKPQSWLLRTFGGAMSGYYNMTAQRPLNNLTRAVLSGVACGMVGDFTSVEPPFDEPLGLGWSLEAQQLAEDAARILHYEAGLSEVIDPFAGSYYMEAMTDQIEEETWDIINKVDSLGGSVACIEQGYMQSEIARSAYLFQKDIEDGKEIVVGINAFTGPEEIEVLTQRTYEHPYDPERRERAEERQIANLLKVKKERNSQAVETCLKRLKETAHDESVSLMPVIVEAVREYASIGEIIKVLREVFGEWRGATI